MGACSRKLTKLASSTSWVAILHPSAMDADFDTTIS
jgi:hypothetical protein